MIAPARAPRFLLFSLCLAGLAANVSGRALEPLVTIISAEFAVGIAVAALLTSAYTLPFALGQPILGPVGDNFGKVRVLRFSLWALTGALVAAALAPTFEALAVARFLAGFAAGGIVPACMATIGDSYPAERRQVVISIFVTMGLLTQIFATSASGLVGETLGWRFVLVGSAFVAVSGAFAATFLLKAAPPVKGATFSVGAAAANYRSVFRNPKAIICYASVFVEGVAFYGVLPYVGAILTLQGEGGASQAGIVIGAMGVGGLVYVSLVALLLRRFDRRHFMAAGGLIMMTGLIALAIGGPWQGAAVAFGVSGFGFMLLHNSIQTEVVDLAPGARQSAYSLHALSFFSGQAAGPPVFGAMFASIGYSTALVMNAIIIAATGLVAWLFFARIARNA